MKKREEMTPIELKALINKNVENHEQVKSEVIKLTHDVDKIEKTINNRLDAMKKYEDEYVELMAVLMSKQGEVPK